MDGPASLAGLWCVNAARLHLPSETAFSLWARLPPVWRVPFSWAQLNSLLAPLMETALVTGTTIGLPFAGLFALSDAAASSQLGMPGLATQAAASLVLPQVYLAFLVLLLEPRFCGRRRACSQGVSNALVWVMLCCLHATALFIFPSPVRVLCALAYDQQNAAVGGVIALFLLELLVVWHALSLIDYMATRPALPPSCEVLGEALCLVDLRAWQTGLRRLRPGVAAAEAAREAAYYGGRRWATWQLLLAGLAVFFWQAIHHAVTSAIALVLHPIELAMDVAAGWTLAPLAAAVQWSLSLALRPLLVVGDCIAAVAVWPLITALRWAAGLVFAARLFLLLAEIAGVFAWNYIDNRRHTAGQAAAAPHRNPQPHPLPPPVATAQLAAQPQRQDQAPVAPILVAQAAQHGWAAAGAVANGPYPAAADAAPAAPAPRHRNRALAAQRRAWRARHRGL